MRTLSALPRRFGGDAEPREPQRVTPGQVWNDESLHGTGGPLLIISVDSAYAYCRDGRDGDGAPRRVALTWFDERRRGGLTLVSTSEGLDDLVERRALTALWAGLPRKSRHHRDHHHPARGDLSGRPRRGGLV